MAPALGAIDILDLGIDLDVWPWVWLVVAVAFALIEITFVGGTFVLLPFAVSAFVASLLGFAGAPIEVQWGMFVIGGAVMFAFAYRWVRAFIQRNELPRGVGADRLIGVTGFVLADIEPSDTNRRGRVTLDGEIWSALAAGDHLIPAGARIRVLEVVGTRVVVEQVTVAETEPEAQPDTSGEGGRE